MPAERRRVSPLAGLALAIEFLTVLPVRRRRVRESAMEPEPPDMASDMARDIAPDMSLALPWFPLVGAALGLALVIFDWLLSLIFPLGIRAVALLAFDALVTGMLHLDGFVDCCDALLGSRTPARRLEILRDSRVGAYGALGGALLLIARYAALNALVGPPRVLALLLAPMLGRWGMVYAVRRYPYARASGAGSPFSHQGVGQFVLATFSMALLLVCNTLAVGSIGLELPFVAVLVALLLLAALLTLFLWLAWASRRLGGGLTGDTYGAACVLVELAILILAPPLALLAGQIVPLFGR